MKKIFFLLLVMGSLIHSVPSNGQCIDKFGFSAGYTHSKLEWRLNPRVKGMSKPFLSGMSIMAFGEKNLNKTFGIRSQFGYMSQGYGSIDYDRFAAAPSYPMGNVEGFRFHQLALDMGLKANLLKGQWKPYVIAGFRGNFTMAYQTLNPYEGNDETYRPIQSFDFKRFISTAVLGLGLELNNAFFIEAEYNPAISDAIIHSYFTGRTSSIGVKVGYNLVNCCVHRCVKPRGSKTITPVF